jgi:hypothetical protein
MPFAVLIFNVTSWILNFLLGNLYFYQKLLPLSAGFCNNNTDLSFKTNIKSRLPHVHGQRISELTHYQTNYLYNSYWYGGQYQDRLPKGCGTDQWKWYCNIISTGLYHSHSISVTIVFIVLKSSIWHILVQYKCIDIFNQDHWRFP